MSQSSQEAAANMQNNAQVQAQTSQQTQQQAPDGGAVGADDLSVTFASEVLSAIPKGLHSP
jgi:hypothetical protein